MDSELKKMKLSRDKKNNLGKKMGNQIWFHKQYLTEMITEELALLFIPYIPNDFNYEIVRWDSKKEELALIECIDFNESKEPTVGRINRIIKTENGFENIKEQKQPKDPLIYHHKWMFVKENYKGFSVEDSKKRSISWKNKLGIDRSVSSKIGRLSFWNNWLKENNLELN